MSHPDTKPSFPALLWQGVRHVLFHNCALKVLAILISVILWAGLISQDESLTRDKTFTDVNVNVVGSETMKRNGYIVVSDLEALLGDVSIVAAVPQMQYENAESSTYNVRVDLSRIASTGEQELKLTSTNSSTFGRVVSTNPSSILVNVEDYIVRQRIPGTVSVGEIPLSWYMSTPSVDPSLVTVAGPKSIVENISRARVNLDPETIEWVEGTLVSMVEIQLYNRAGEAVDRSLLEITSDSLNIDSALVEATLLPTKTFDVAEMIEATGVPAFGFIVKDIRVSPESITVAARADVLSQMDAVPMERTISVQNLQETTVFQLKVQKPSEDAVLSNDTVTVTVEIGLPEVPEEPEEPEKPEEGAGN